MFVVRNVANLVPPYAPDDDYHGTSAALEFGVMGLRVEHIVVMGHAQCGGVRAFAEFQQDPFHAPLSPGDFISSWIRLIAPSAARLGAAPAEPTPEYLERLALESIKQSIVNLRSFPCIKTLEERGKMKLHGCYFGVMDGRLLRSTKRRHRSCRSPPICMRRRCRRRVSRRLRTRRLDARRFDRFGFAGAAHRKLRMSLGEFGLAHRFGGLFDRKPARDALFALAATSCAAAAPSADTHRPGTGSPRRCACS